MCYAHKVVRAFRIRHSETFCLVLPGFKVRLGLTPILDKVSLKVRPRLPFYQASRQD